MVDVFRAIAFANDAANHSKLSEDTTKKDVLMKRRASLLKRASSVVSKWLKRILQGKDLPQRRTLVSSLY